MKLDELRKEYVKFNENINKYNIDGMTRFINKQVDFKLHNLVKELHENNLEVDSNFYKYCSDSFDVYKYNLETIFNVKYQDVYKQIGNTSSKKLDNNTIFYVNINNQVLVTDDFLYDREIIDNYTLPIYIQEVKKMMDDIEKYAQNNEIDNNIENNINMLLNSLDEFNNESLLQLDNLYDIHQFTLEYIEQINDFENYKEYYDDYLCVEELEQDFER